MNIHGGRFLLSILMVVASLSFLKEGEAGDISEGLVCRVYGDKNVYFEGIISASPFVWPTKKRGEHYSSFTLHVDEQFCVLPGGDELEPRFEAVDNVELGVIDAEGYRKIKRMIGARVRCLGNLQPALSGYHANSLILWDSMCARSSSEGN